MLFKRHKRLPLAASGSSVASPPTDHHIAGDLDQSVIGRNTRFRGEIRGRGPLLLRGHVEGKVGIEDRLTVDRGARLDAETRTTVLVVAGSATGGLQIRDTLALLSTGTVEGRIQAHHLLVEEGGILNGTVIHSESAGERPTRSPSQPPDDIS